MSVKRVYVEQQVPYAIKAKELKEEIKSYLGIKTVTGVMVLIRYDIENLSEEAAGGQENIRGIYTGDSFYLVSPDSISSYNMKEGYTSIATLGLS